MVFACTAFPGSTSLLPLLARAPPSAAISISGSLIRSWRLTQWQVSEVALSSRAACAHAVEGRGLETGLCTPHQVPFHRDTGKTQRSMMRLPPSRPRLMPCPPAVVWDGHETQSVTGVLRLHLSKTVLPQLTITSRPPSPQYLGTSCGTLCNIRRYC